MRPQTVLAQKRWREEESATTYESAPIDTSEVELSEDLAQLTEDLARHVHEVWARQRIEDGWQYGPQRDDAQKEHPCLVPYEELPESEKEYDRLTALETLRAMLALGYRIEPRTDVTVGEREFGPPAAEVPGTTAHERETPTEPTADSLPLLWQEWQRRNWTDTPETYRRFGEWFLSLGAPLMAYDVVSEGLRKSDDDVRLRQLLGLALARTGASQRANAVLGRLRDEGHADEETLGMLARTHKDLWQQATHDTKREQELAEAQKGYEEAYKGTGGYWTGINAATMALIGGDAERATALARSVHEKCLDEVARCQDDGSDPYWPLATLGEAALILGDVSEAVGWYARAAEVGAGRFGDLSSTRRNARLIAGVVGCDMAPIEECLRVPNVVVFAGHMIDQPDRACPRFPPKLVDPVYDEILERLKRCDCQISYGSAACGADILFSEAILELEGEAHVVLPYERDEFVADSVAIAGQQWQDRLDRVLGGTTSVATASAAKLEGGSVSYHYADLLVYGLAGMRARELQTGLVPMAVWDEQPGDGPGGTESIVRHWGGLGHGVEVIRIDEILREQLPQQAMARRPAAQATCEKGAKAGQELAPEIMSVLFADLDDFGRLTEAEIINFVQEFIGGVGQLIANSAHPPEISNTWGDAVFLVFSSPRAAGQFALELNRFANETDWRTRGLPPDLRLCIGLHAGPVHPCTGPVTGGADCFGTHVTHAARIMPIAPPGQVYASQAFAALAAAEGVTEFACEYVGEQPLPREPGTHPTYHVRARV